MKILVGSKNQVKIASVEEAFSKFFSDVETECREVDSSVSKQPINEEAFHGARNRVMALIKLNRDEGCNADYLVGIEGGVIELHQKWFVIGCVCIADKEGKLGFGTSPMFELPESVSSKVRQGIELGLVMDKLTGAENIKQKGGAIGFFTKEVMKRKDLYVPGVITALVPFLNKELYF